MLPSNNNSKRFVNNLFFYQNKNNMYIICPLILRHKKNINSDKKIKNMINTVNITLLLRIESIHL